MARTTLSTIAKCVGLSRAGVSKALSGHPDMNKETIRKVRQVAKELNYTPSTFGRALRTGRINIYGLVGHDVPGLSQRSHFAGLFDAMLRQCHQNQYDLILFDPLDVSHTTETSVPRIIAQGMVEGVLLLMADTTTTLVRELTRLSVPWVVIEDIHHLASNAVGIDADVMGTLVADHLIDRGARQLVYFDVPHAGQGDLFHRGVQEAMQRRCTQRNTRHQTCCLSRSWYAPQGPAGLRDELHAWLQRKETFARGPVGVMVAESPLGHCLLSLAMECHISVPEQMLVLSPSNDMACQLAQPTMSAFDAYDAMACAATEMLAARVEQASRNIPSRRIPPRLIERQSTIGA